MIHVNIGNPSRSPSNPLFFLITSRPEKCSKGLAVVRCCGVSFGMSKLRSAGVLACEFRRRPAAPTSLVSRINTHRDAGTRSQGWLRYAAGLRYMAATPLPSFRARAKASVHRIHQRVVAAAMQILILAHKVFVGFVLPERNNFPWQPFVNFVRGERFPTVQDVAQYMAGHRPHHNVGMIGHD